MVLAPQMSINPTIVGSNIGSSINVTSTPGTGNLTATTVNACVNLAIITKPTFKGPAPLARFTSQTDYYGLNLNIPAQTGCTYQWRFNGVLVSTTNNYRIPYPSCGSGANTWFPIQLTVTNTWGATGVSNQYYTYVCYPTSVSVLCILPMIVVGYVWQMIAITPFTLTLQTRN